GTALAAPERTLHSLTRQFVWANSCEGEIHVAASWVDRLGAVPRRRWLPIAAGFAAIVLLLAVAIYFYDHSRRDVIANGVRIDGIAVGGLHTAAARKKIESDVVVRLNHPVTVRFGTHKWRL